MKLNLLSLVVVMLLAASSFGQCDLARKSAEVSKSYVSEPVQRIDESVLLTRVNELTDTVNALNDKLDDLNEKFDSLNEYCKDTACKCATVGATTGTLKPLKPVKKVEKKVESKPVVSTPVVQSPVVQPSPVVYQQPVRQLQWVQTGWRRECRFGVCRQVPVYGWR